MLDPVTFAGTRSTANESMGENPCPSFVSLFRMATWRSGDAVDCKSTHPGSIPGVASNPLSSSCRGLERRGLLRRPPPGWRSAANLLNVPRLADAGPDRGRDMRALGSQDLWAGLIFATIGACTLWFAVRSCRRASGDGW